MRSIRMVFRSELLRRWASWTALVFLVALIGGTVLAGASAAQRTSSAFSQFISRYGFDAEIFASRPFTKEYFDLPYVTAVVENDFYANGNAIANGRFVPSNDVGVFSLPTSHLDTTIRLISGRMPVGPHEVLAGFSMQQQFGLRVGSTVTVPFYSLAQGPSIVSTNAYVAPRGARISFHVVGFEASEPDFPTSTPSYSLYTSRAFDIGQGRHVYAGSFAQVRLAHGVNDIPRLQLYVNHHPHVRGFTFLVNADTAAASVAGSIQPQATGWWLFALFTALAGLALVGQALSRQSIVESDAYPTLAAMGLRPRQLFGLGLARAGVIGVAGALGALILAVAVSPLTPVGEARAAEPTQGFVFDFALLGLGFLVIVATVLCLAIYPSWRASQSRGGQNTRVGSLRRDNSLATSIAKLGAPPSVSVGVRNAFNRGRGRTSVPVTTALVGAAVAVTALVATTVFGASLSHLLTTPRLYGQNWQLDMGNMTRPQVNQALAATKHNPQVTKISWGIGGVYVRVKKVEVQSILVAVAKGPMAFSLVEGRYPKGDAQIALGATTLAQARLHVGSRASVAIVNKSGKLRSREMTVVGVVSLPPTFSIGGLGVGAVVPIHAAEVTVCPSGPAQKACIRKLVALTSGWGMAVGIAAGTAGHATLLRLERRFAPFVNVLYPPTNLVNFGQAVDFPLLLGLTLALFGAATLAHVLFVSVARRRRQVALLRVLGFVRRQVLATTCWQAVTIAVVGIVPGVPIGIAVGGYVWRVFASHLGAVPEAVTPGVLIAVVCGVIVGGGVVLSLVPAFISGRVHPAEALREA